jgi:hypothetical protein
MKVFISWSGERSKAVAEALRYWLPKVIQAVQPWMSANDIDKGTRWRTDIASELEQSSIGVICLTPENLDSTWLHFEAGALSKQQQNTYVCTFLYDLEPADVREPLAQFQSTKAQRDDVKKLIQTINNNLGERKLPESEINESFDVWWVKLEQRLKDIPQSPKVPEPQRPDRDILEEILGLVRERARTEKVIEKPPVVKAHRIVSGGVLTSSDIRRLANFYELPDNDIISSSFDEDDLIELIKVLRREERESRTKKRITEQDRGARTFDKEDLNENSNP